MLIIFPVAGRGTRFYPETKNIAKCLLPVKGKMMIEWALASVYCPQARIVIIDHQEQGPEIESTLKGLIPNTMFIHQKEPLTGAAHTVYQSKEIVQQEKDVIIVDCDIHARSIYQNEGWEHFDGDGSVLTFTSTAPTKSYVRMAEGFVVEAVEKKVISHQAIGGIFHFREGNQLVQAIEDVMERDIKCKGEFYVSSVLMSYIKNNPKVRAFNAEAFFDLGMPEGIKQFEQLTDRQVYG